MRIFRSKSVIGDGDIGIRKVDVRQGFPLHTHDYIELEYICDGEGVHTVDGEEFHVRRGDMIFMNYGATHSFATDSGFSHIEIYFSPKLAASGGTAIKNSLALLTLSSFDGMRQNRNGGVISFSGQARRDVEYILECMVAERNEENTGYESVLTSYLNVLLVKMLREADKGDMSENIWQSVKSYIDTNAAERITLTDLAERCFYNPSYFSRAFKQKFGSSLTEYVRSRRIELAKIRLETVDESIESVMQKVGFTDRSAFYRAFSELVGMTPAEYRAAYKNKGK